MNRAEKTKQYLINRLVIFKGYKDLINSKQEFFATVRKFRETTVSHLCEMQIINEEDLQKLDKSLADIDTKKTKGVNNKVYWRGVQPEYDKVQFILNELILNMDTIKVPFSIRFEDYLKNLVAEKSTRALIVGAAIIIIGLFITYLISLLSK